MWKPQVDVFSGRHHVLTPDLPGFGPSAEADERSVAQVLAQLCDSLEIRRAHVVALSLGGAVAIDFALSFPARVRSLTLVDALLRGRPSGIQAWSRCAAPAKEGRMEEATDAWLADPLFASARRQPQVFVRLREMALDYRGGHWTGRSSTRFEIEDPASRLGEI